MRRPGCTLRRAVAVVVTLALSACAEIEAPEHPDDALRAVLLDRPLGELVTASLADRPSADVTDAQRRVRGKISPSMRTRLGSLQLAPGRATALVDDPELRAARGASAVALGTQVDRVREADVASMQLGLDTLRAELQRLRAGATRCDELGDKADACVIGLLIIEVKRCEARGPLTMADAGVVVVTGTMPGTADPPMMPTKPDAGMVVPPAATCSDPFEKNDTAATATALVFDATNTAQISANAKAQNFDWYSFTPLKADPMWIVAEYSTAPKLAYLSMEGEDSKGNTQWRKTPGMEVPSATLSGWLLPSEVGAAHRLKFEVITGGCFPYTLKVSLDACTDAFEDNDSRAQAKPIAPEQDHQATILGGEYDWFDLAALTASKGSCTVRYTVKKANDVGVIATVYGASGTLGVANPTGQLEKTTTVSWSGGAAQQLRLESGFSGTGDCIQYSLRCSAQ